MNFTQLGSKADSAIGEMLDVVVSVIREQIPSVRSIVLGGSFGRGEGSVEPVGDEVVPLNDFDMFVINDQPISDPLLNQIANEAIAKLHIPRSTGTDFYVFDRNLHANTFYVDLKALTPRKLTQLPPMIRYYELRNSGSTIWGEDMLSLIPDYDIADLPLAEGFRLLLNRMAMLALYFSIEFLERPMTRNEKYGLLYLGSKSMLGCCGALLLLNGRYRPSYLERAKILDNCYAEDFPRLYERVPQLPERVRQAVDFKLNADFSGEIDAFAIWSEWRDIIWEVLCAYGETYFGVRAADPAHMSALIHSQMPKRYYRPYLHWYMRNKFGFSVAEGVASFLLQRYMNVLVYKRFREYGGINNPRILFNRRALDIILYSALVPLLKAVDSAGQVDGDLLSIARKMLEKVHPVKSIETSNPHALWQAVDDAFSNAYANFSFLKIV